MANILSFHTWVWLIPLTGAGPHHCCLWIRLEEKENPGRRECKDQKRKWSSVEDSQESLLWEMWKELKFAVNWNAGDTKPIRQGRSSRWMNWTLQQQQQQGKLQQLSCKHDKVPGQDRGQCWARATLSLWTSSGWSALLSLIRRAPRVGRCKYLNIII